MSHHVCVPRLSFCKTTVDDGTPCSGDAGPAAVTHDGAVIIVHIITASHSICRKDNLIGGLPISFWKTSPTQSPEERGEFWGLPFSNTYKVYGTFI